MKSLLQWVASTIGVPPLKCAAFGIGLLVAILYFRLFFGSFWGFRRDIDNDSKIPLLDKDYDYVESRRSHNKILIWLLLSVGSGVLAYHELPNWFPNLFR